MTVQMYCQWEYYPGNELFSLALPDYYSNYLSYTINFTEHPNTGLQIQYRGLIDKVPELPNPLDLSTLNSYEASLYIGDYAPSGRIVPIKTFLEFPQSIFKE